MDECVAQRWDYAVGDLMYTITLKDIVDEDFVNYKVPSMTLMFPKCNFKCDTEAGTKLCHNSSLVQKEDVTVNVNINTYTSTGHISYTNVKAKDADLSASTSHVYLNNVNIENHLKIQTSTGDVYIKSSDAASLYIKASTGDIEAELLSSKIFKVETSTGKINVPTSTSGGLCEVTTSTGDIHITIKN